MDVHLIVVQRVVVHQFVRVVKVNVKLIRVPQGVIRILIVVSMVKSVLNIIVVVDVMLVNQLQVVLLVIIRIITVVVPMGLLI